MSQHQSTSWPDCGMGEGFRTRSEYEKMVPKRSPIYNQSNGTIFEAISVMEVNYYGAGTKGRIKGW